MKKIDEIRGVIPALVTPFDRDENLDEPKLRNLVEHLLQSGVHGLYLTGSTGEGFLMSSEERKTVVEVVVDQVDSRVPLVAHIGAIGTRKSIGLAQHAEQHNIDAISSVPPFYWNFDGPSIYNYYQDITGSTSLPMIVYNIALAGLVGYDQIIQLASIKGVKGIKYTATSHHEILGMKEELGTDFMVYSGADEMALSGLTFGADGIIGSFYNLIPEVFIELYEALMKNDIQTAQEKQRMANAIINFSNRYQYLSVIKRALKWMGVDGGYCRKPFKNYTEDEETQLKREFNELQKLHNIEGVRFLDSV